MEGGLGGLLEVPEPTDLRPQTSAPHGRLRKVLIYRTEEREGKKEKERGKGRERNSGRRTIEA